MEVAVTPSTPCVGVSTSQQKGFCLNLHKMSTSNIPGQQAAVRAGHTYPDIETQAKHLEDAKKRTRERILKAAGDLSIQYGIEAILFAIDSIRNEAHTAVQLAEDLEPTSEYWEDMASKIDGLCAIASTLAEIRENCLFLDCVSEKIKLTDAGVLL